MANWQQRIHLNATCHVQMLCKLTDLLSKTPGVTLPQLAIQKFNTESLVAVLDPPCACSGGPGRLALVCIAVAGLPKQVTRYQRRLRRAVKSGRLYDAWAWQASAGRPSTASPPIVKNPILERFYARARRRPTGFACCWSNV